MPAPFAMPPTVHPSACTCTACLATVSVVRMASAASGPPSLSRAAAARVMPASSASIGSRSPISPVEHTATSPAPMSSAVATYSAVAWVSANPAGPVHALAPPELRTTARSRPSATACRDHSTGAACTRLRVKTAAAASDGPSLTTSATSRPPDSFRPAATPAARNPPAAVTLMGRPHRPSGRLSQEDPASGWRSAPPDRRRPYPGCRSR